MDSDGEVDVEELAILRRDFAQPDSVLIHVLRDAGSLEDAHARLARHEQQQPGESAPPERSLLSTVTILRGSLTLALLSQPLIRLKCIQQYRGCSLFEAFSIALSTNRFLGLWQGVEMTFAGRVAALYSKQLAFDFVVDLLSPEGGWEHVSDRDRRVIVGAAYTLTSLLTDVVGCPFRVCGARAAAAAEYDILYWLRPFSEAGVWGYFKGLGSLLLSRLVGYAVKPRLKDVVPAWVSMRLGPWLPDISVATPIVHAGDTLFVLMAHYGNAYLSVLSLLLERNEESSPLVGRSRFLPFDGLLMGILSWNILGKLG